MNSMIDLFRLCRALPGETDMSEVNNRDPLLCRNERKSFVRRWSIRLTRSHRTGRRGWSTMENMYIEQLPLPKNTAPRATELSVPFVGGNITFVFSWSVGDIYLQLLFRRTRTAPLATNLADPFVCGADCNCIRRRSFMVSGGHASAVTLSENTAPTATELANTFVCGTDFDQIK